MSKPKKVLVLGSGALKIGEAGEFDYSGSQALKTLRAEGITSVLVNPNIATIQTSRGIADSIYFLPVTPYFVEQVIVKERPDAVFLSFGGQTALNCGMELEKKGVFKRYKMQVLGTSIDSIRATEDRNLFKQKLAKLNLKTPKSTAVTTVKHAHKAAAAIGYPLIIRGAFSLGGQGSAIVHNIDELTTAVATALATTQQILVEEYLHGWKEIEYEVVRDAYNNCVTVCNMENLDPMGIHTGDSIVVAPSQTLNQEDYFSLRDISIRTICGLNIVGECNIQFALDPTGGDYRIIEINARLSRSSALASKATGYPLAAVAAKLALGFRLSDIKNSVTQSTSAFFEPALDYLVVKMPRWDLHKLKHVTHTIGSEMKSVGEVMAIGRSFPECIQKAARMIELGHEGVVSQQYQSMSLAQLRKQLALVTPERLFLLTAALSKGLSVEHAHALTRIDPWFLHQLAGIADVHKQLMRAKRLNQSLLRSAKRFGFSDNQIALLRNTSEKHIRFSRKKHKIMPVVKQIDTLAGEFPAKTNYLYLTYHGVEDDISFRPGSKTAVLGGGPYHIGSSVEFDWCAVNTVFTLGKLGRKTAMINCNPETVSTDYDIADTLYFEELTLERVLDIWDKERFAGTVLAMGGQVPNTLAVELHRAGVSILGTHPKDIDRAENRHTFSQMLDRLGIAQPPWKELADKSDVFDFAKEVGYPLLIRPSYVLSGTAMAVVYTNADIEEFLNKQNSTWGYPVVVSKLLEHTQEFDFDAVAHKGKIIVSALCEHVEEGGVHSGDATLVLSPQQIAAETVTKIKDAATKIVKALHISGPFNIQFLARDGHVWVIETNLRASRSFPFCSKITKTNFIDIATRSMLNRLPSDQKRELFFFSKKHDYVGVKAPQFSFGRLRGADPILRVEMASTGEVAAIGDTLEDAFLKTFLARGNMLPDKSLLITIGGEVQKYEFLEHIRTLHELGYRLYATGGTTQFLATHGIPATTLRKRFEGGKLSVIDYIAQKKVDMVIILSDKPDAPAKRRRIRRELTDGYHMRRVAADVNVPVITNMQLAKLFVRSLARLQNVEQLSIKKWV